VDAVLLAVCSAALFGGMTVALKVAMARGGDADTGALLTILVALAVALPFALAQGADAGELWPFALAGLLGPGVSQLLFTFAIRDAGPARTSVLVGTAPLFSVAIALALLDEPVQAGLIAGAVLIVVGGILLVGERARPEHVKRVGLLFALLATVVFAVRDNVVRWLAVETDAAPPGAAAAATLAAGALVATLYLVGARRRPPVRDLPLFAPAGVAFGLSYIALFEAYYRGRVSVVSPLVATESLWGVGLTALFLRRHERVGPRLLAGAGCVVLGGMRIGALR
jgi:drug/metabolite transporter (DMT)-like permease